MMRIKVSSFAGFKMKSDMARILEENQLWAPRAMLKHKNAKPLYEQIETHFGIKTEWDEDLCASVFILGDSEASTMYALMLENYNDVE